MERMISTNRVGMPIPQRKVPVGKTPEIEIIMPGRGTTGPVRIGRLLEPIKQIINHPDRNRLMAELFKDYK
jgi:hypothetical protein